MTFPHSFPFAVFHVSSTRVTAGADWRHPSLRRLLCRVLLHPLLHVDEPVLLRVRLHAARVPHPHNDLCRDYGGAHLLPALLRGLQLVVALRPHLG